LGPCSLLLMFSSDLVKIYLVDPYVSTQTRNLPVLKMAFPFPILALSFFGFHFWTFSIWYGTQTGNLPLLVVGVTHFVPFPELGSSSSGTVIVGAPFWNWTLCPWSHFRYWAMPFLVRSLLGSYQNWALCAWSHFRYWAMPFPVRSFS
jgi:hypothetical protein